MSATKPGEFHPQLVSERSVSLSTASFLIFCFFLSCLHYFTQTVCQNGTISVPLRGKEVLFLRKALKMNRNQWADKLGLTASGILRWEQGGDKRLSRINEAAIRMLCAEELTIALEGKWSSVISEKELPERLEVAA